MTGERMNGDELYSLLQERHIQEVQNRRSKIIGGDGDSEEAATATS